VRLWIIHELGQVVDTSRDETVGIERKQGNNPYNDNEARYSGI